MKFKITCPFSLSSSHEIHEAGFRGENKIDLEIPFSQENFLGIIGTSIEITSHDKYDYNLIVTSESLNTKEE